MDATNEIVELTTELIGKRPVTVAGAERCFDYIDNYLGKSGLHAERFESNGVPSVVFSTRKGTRNPKILLHGHVDVVSGNRRMFDAKVVGDYLWGRGAADMLGGVAAELVLMKELARMDRRIDIALMLTSDEEEGGGNGTCHLVREEGYRPSFGITAEPNTSSQDFPIVVKQKGHLTVDVQLKGKSAHASTPNRGVNAIDAADEVKRSIKARYNLMTDSPEGFWQPSAVVVNERGGGKNSNVIPDKARVTFDIRLTENNHADVLEYVKSLPYVTKVTVIDQGPLMNTRRSNPFVNSLKLTVERITKSSCEAKYGSGSSDMKYLTEAGIPAVKFGPVGIGQHTKKEGLHIPSLNTYLTILREFVLNI